MADKAVVIVTRRLPEGVERALAERFGARLNNTDRAFTREELGAALRQAVVLVPTITDRMDKTLLDAAGAQLKLLANFGAGLDHIDVATARERGITVTNT